MKCELEVGVGTRSCADEGGGGRVLQRSGILGSGWSPAARLLAAKSARNGGLVCGVLCSSGRDGEEEEEEQRDESC